MKPDTAAPTRSPDNSSSLPEAKGRNSRASSSCPSSRTDGSWRRERRSSCGGGGGGQASVLPGPVSHGKCTRNVVYYQNRFLVIDSAPAKLASSSAGGSGAHGAVTTATTTTTTATTTTQPAVTRTTGGGASGSSARAAGETDAANRSAAARRKATNVAAATALSSGRQMASIPSASSAGYCDADATAPAAAAPAAAATAISAADHGAGGGCSSRTAAASRRNQPGRTHVQEMAACPVTMPDGRGIEIIVSDETGVSHRPDTRTSRASGKRALLKRVGTVLLDNRMRGKENCQRLLTEHPEEYRVLKRVLNIIFVTVGMALLVSVFVVIVYTAVVGNRSSNDGSSSQAAAEQQSDSNSTVV